MKNILILFISLSNITAQTLLPLPDEKDFYAEASSVEHKNVFLFANGQTDFKKIDEASISSKFAIYYQPSSERYKIYSSINRGLLAEKSQDTNFINIVYFPASIGYLYSGGVYFSPWESVFSPPLNVIRKNHAARLKKEEEKQRKIKEDTNNKIDSLEQLVTHIESIKDSLAYLTVRDSLIKQSKIISNQISALKPDINTSTTASGTQIVWQDKFDEIQVFSNLNYFNRNITIDSVTERKFSAWNIETGFTVNWYYFTNTQSIKTSLSCSFGYTELIDGEEDYNKLFNKNNDKVLPTAIRNLGVKFAVQLNHLTLAVEMKLYIGKKDNLIESLRGPKINITTAVDGTFLKF